MPFTYCEDSFSDFYKDVNGFRPRGHEFYYAEPARKQVIWDMLIAENEAQMIAQEEADRNAVIAYEKRIEDLMSCGAKDRKTAIRWLIESVDSLGDYDFVAYRFNLPYSHSTVKEIKDIMKEMS